MTCLRTGHFPVYLFVVKVSVNHLFKTVWWNGFWCSRFKCGVSSCSSALQLSNCLIVVDVSVVRLHSSLPTRDLTTAVQYTVQTWLLDSQFVIQETQIFLDSGPVLLMWTDNALLIWCKVVWIKARWWWCICLKSGAHILIHVLRIP
jgi:hypothetical protein